MRIIHSFWSKPCNNIKQQVWMYALSLAYLKREGATTVLHTDSVGKELFQLLPYDEIHTTLDSVPDWIDTKFFAAGKFYAQRGEDLGSVHIDGDVFLKKKSLLDSIEHKLNNSDLIVQHFEIGRNKIYENTIKVLEKYIPNPPFKYDFFIPASCGTIGFNNQIFKEDYFEMYFNFLKLVHSIPECLNELKTTSDVIPDLICEQQFLIQLAHEKNIRISSVLEKTPKFINEEAKSVGYQHLITSYKWYLIPMVKKYLKLIDLNLYKLLNKNL